MLFWSDKAEKNGPTVEAKLLKELGANQPLHYETEIEGQFKPNSVGQALGDASAYLFGGHLRPLYNFHFQITAPKKFEVRVHVIKEGPAVVLGALLYSMVLKKKIHAPVMLENKKMLAASKFSGDQTLADKLNNNNELIKMINKFVRTSYQVGDAKVTTERSLKIMPFEDGALLAVNTLPKSKWMGLTSIFDVQAFLQIAATVEAAL